VIAALPILGLGADRQPLAIDVDQLIGSHALVVGNSGSGKSGLLRRLLEATHGRVQQIVLDPEDELYTLRERYDFVIAGGEGSDAPVSAANARGLALGALQHGFSLIVQLNDLGAGADEFVERFIDGLLSAPQDLWRPVLIAIDELQRFAGPNRATAVGDLAFRGRKRGFTLVGATPRMTAVDPAVRGMVNNWLLGRVGQTLDRNTMADQLGFTRSEGRDKLRGLERRWFWGFGPAIAAEPRLFLVDETSTTIVQRGQARLPTPPAPEAMREILQGLSASPTEASADGAPAFPPGAEEILARASDDLRAAATRIGELEGQVEAERLGRLQAEALARSHADVLFSIQKLIAGQAAGDPRVTGTAASQAGGDEDVEAPPPPAPVPAGGEEARAPGKRRERASSTSDDSAHPLAVTLAEKMASIAPAKLTWRQLASLCGYKPDGGYFRGGKRDALNRGLLIEDGGYVRSARESKRSLDRASAYKLWADVLPEPAPRLMEALAGRRGECAKKGELAAELGYSADGGYFRKGLSLLRQNGVITESGDVIGLAGVLPGQVG